MTRVRFAALFSLASAIAIGVPAVAVAGDAPKAPPPPNACIIVRAIDGWHDVDEKTAIIRTSPSKSYKVTFWAPCREMKNAIALRIERGPGTMCLSRGDTLVFNDALPGRRGAFEERCVIDSIERVPETPKPPPS